MHIYNFIDNVDINKDKMDYILQKFLGFLIPSGLSFFSLNVKVKALIILFCKLYPIFGHCNGTWMIATWHE